MAASRSFRRFALSAGDGSELESAGPDLSSESELKSPAGVVADEAATISDSREEFLMSGCSSGTCGLEGFNRNTVALTSSSTGEMGLEIKSSTPLSTILA